MDEMIYEMNQSILIIFFRDKKFTARDSWRFRSFVRVQMSCIYTRKGKLFQTGPEPRGDRVVLRKRMRRWQLYARIREPSSTTWKE